MLSLTIFLPLMTGLLVLALPAGRAVRLAALAGSLATLALTIAAWGAPAAGPDGLRWHASAAWIPPIGARYEIGLSGVSLPLATLAALLLAVAMLYVLPRHERAREHAFLFLLMGTGLLGVFAARDLLLFYVYFEVALVPMYFIVGMFGGEERHYAALEFFLYTRAGSLAMLVSFLALYLGTDPHSFALADIAAARPFAGSPAGLWVLLGLLLGFGVKLPTVPLHNWLPDAHVEAPTEGSVLLAGAQLKMGGYGLVAILVPSMPDATERYAWLLLALGLVSLLYGALAALAQRDVKRSIAYTSVNHMGFVMLGVAVWGLAADPAVRRLALSGAVVQMVSHGLLTGGMFLVVGMLAHRAGTRQLDRLGGWMARAPVLVGVLGVLAFGSLGVPGMSGFVAEVQVLAATLAWSAWAVVPALVGLILTTAVYLRVVGAVALGAPASREPARLGARELLALAPLALGSLAIGVMPAWLTRVVDAALAGWGG